MSLRHDPVSDMLTRIRNAITAKKCSVAMPSSKVKVAIAEVLQKQGYIAAFNVTEDGFRKNLEITLKYDHEEKSVIDELRRVSRPSLKIYKKTSELPKVLGGLGVALISTSKGIMTCHEARKANLGGEVLCYVA